MTRRARHPLKTLLMLVAFSAAAWFAYENREKLRLGQDDWKPDAALLDRITEKVAERFKDDPCLTAVQSNVIWRASENRFKLSIDVDPACGEDARKLCGRIADLIEAEGRYPASVWAYNGAGDLVTHVIR